jgi:hypothetical protein
MAWLSVKRSNSIKKYGMFRNEGFPFSKTKYTANQNVRRASSLRCNQNILFITGNEMQERLDKIFFFGFLWTSCVVGAALGFMELNR